MIVEIVEIVEIFYKEKYTCHYCNSASNNENELINHNINSHPNKIAQPDESPLKLDRNHDYYQYDHLIKEVMRHLTRRIKKQQQEISN